MRVLIRVAAFSIIVALFHELHYFAYFDPTDTNGGLSVSNIALPILALSVAILGAIIIGRVFQKSLKLTPMFLGVVCGYYLI